MKKLFALGLLALLVVLASTASAQASPRQAFYFEKVCPSLDNPLACDISGSVPFAQLNGGQIIYNDRVYWENPAGNLFEIARIQLTTGNDSGTAVGQVRWLKDYGLFTISQGTGSLAGLHVNARVEFKDYDADGRWRFTVSGTYHLDP